jgi:hypothetical protein
MTKTKAEIAAYITDLNEIEKALKAKSIKV